MNLHIKCFFLIQKNFRFAHVVPFCRLKVCSLKSYFNPRLWFVSVARWFWIRSGKSNSVSITGIFRFQKYVLLVLLLIITMMLYCPFVNNSLARIKQKRSGSGSLLVGRSTDATRLGFPVNSIHESRALPSTSWIR